MHTEVINKLHHSTLPNNLRVFSGSERGWEDLSQVALALTRHCHWHRPWHCTMRTDTDSGIDSRTDNGSVLYFDSERGWEDWSQGGCCNSSWKVYNQHATGKERGLYLMTPSDSDCPNFDCLMNVTASWTWLCFEHDCLLNMTVSWTWLSLRHDCILDVTVSWT